VARDTYLEGLSESALARKMAENLPRWNLKELADEPSDGKRNRAARLALVMAADGLLTLRD